MTHENLSKANHLVEKMNFTSTQINNLTCLLKDQKGPLSYECIFDEFSHEHSFGLYNKMKEPCIKALKGIISKRIKELKADLSNMEKEFETI